MLILEVMNEQQVYDGPSDSLISKTHSWNGGRRGRDRMVVGFITTYAISAYHH
jgi:hypothetical protein